MSELQSALFPEMSYKSFYEKVVRCPANADTMGEVLDIINHLARDKTNSLEQRTCISQAQRALYKFCELKETEARRND